MFHFETEKIVIARKKKLLKRKFLLHDPAQTNDTIKVEFDNKGGTPEMAVL